MADEKFTPPSDAVAETKFTPPTDAIADTQKKSQSETTTGAKEPSGADLGTQQGQQSESGGKDEQPAEQVAPIELPKTYERTEPSTYKNLVGGQKYFLSRGGKRIVGTWDAEKGEFIKDPLLSATPQVKKEVGFLQAIEVGMTLKPPMETEEEALARVSMDTDEVKKEIATKIENVDNLTGYPLVRRYMQLNELYSQSDDPKQRDAIKKELDKLKDKNVAEEGYLGAQISTDETPVYTNAYLPSLPPYKQFEEFKGELPKIDKTVGQAASEILSDKDFIKQGVQEVNQFDGMLNQYLLDKLPQEKQLELSTIKDPEEYNTKFQEALVESKEVENVIPALFMGLSQKMDALGNLGSNLGLDDDKLAKKKLNEIRYKELFNKQPKGFAAELTSSVGGMLPDLTAGAAYAPLMLMSMMSTMPNDYLEQSIAEDYYAGRPIDIKKAKQFAAVSTAMQGGMLVGAGVVGGQGLKLVGKTRMKRAGELLYEIGKRGTKDAIIFGALGTKLQNQINKAYNVTENDDYLHSMVHMAAIGGLFAAKEGFPQLKLSTKQKSEIDYMASYLPQEYTKQQIEQLVGKGLVTPTQGEETLKKLNDYRTVLNELPTSEIDYEQMDKIYPLWLKKQELQGKISGATPELKSVLSGQISELDRKILVEAAIPLTAEEKLELNKLVTDEAQGKLIDKSRKKYLEDRKDAANNKEEAIKRQQEQKAAEELTAKPEAVTEGEPKTETDATQTIQQQEGVSAERKTGGEGGETRETSGGDSVQRKAEGAEEGKVAEGGVTAPTPETTTPQAGSVVGGENPALKDVESTAKALEGVDRDMAHNLTNWTLEKSKRLKELQDKEDDETISKSEKVEFDVLMDEFDLVNEDKLDEANIKALGFLVDVPHSKNTPKSISEAYHRAKADGTNPELVKAVEDLLKPKEYETETTTKEEQPVLEGVRDGGDKTKAGQESAELRPEGEEKVGPSTSTKIVDNQGNPLVVYHGSTADLSKGFKPKSYGTYGEHEYFYFAKSKGWVEKFKKEEPIENRDKFKIGEFTLDIKNPLDITNKAFTIDGWIKYFEDNGISLSDETKMDWAKRSGKNTKDTIASWQLFRYDNGKFRGDLLKAGYDGLIISDVVRGKADNTVYVALKNEQIIPKGGKVESQATPLQTEAESKAITEPTAEATPSGIEAPPTAETAPEQVQNFEAVLAERTDKKRDKALKAFGEQEARAKELLDNYDANVDKLKAQGIEPTGTKAEVLADMMSGKYDKQLKEPSAPASEVEATANKLKGITNAISIIASKLKDVFYTGRGKKYEDLKKTRADYLFFSKNKDVSSWYGGDETNVTEAFVNKEGFLDLTSQDKKAKFVEDNVTDKEIDDLYPDLSRRAMDDRDVRKTYEQKLKELIDEKREQLKQNRFSGDNKEQKFLIEKAKKMGFKGIELLDTFFGEEDVSTIVIDKNRIEQLTPQSISEAYHADKAAGKETELTKAVEDLLGEPQETSAKETEVQRRPTTMPDGEPGVELFVKNPDGTEKSIGKFYPEDTKEMAKVEQGYKLLDKKKIAEDLKKKAEALGNIGKKVEGVEPPKDTYENAINPLKVIMKGIGAIEKVTFGKLSPLLEKGTATAVRKGLEHNNRLINGAASILQGLVRTLPLTSEEVDVRRKALGKVSASALEALKFYDKAFNSVGGSPQSLRNVHMVLDPEVYVKRGETPLTFAQLSPSEQALYQLLRNANDVIHDWHYVNGRIDDATYILNKDKYMPRVYEEIEFDADVNEFVGGMTNKADFSYLKQRKEFENVGATIIEDPAYGTALRLGQMLRNQAVIDYANDVATRTRTYNEGDVIPPNYVKLSGTKNVFGDLTNKYVPRYIAEDFKGYQFMSPIMDNLYGVVKKYDRIPFRRFLKSMNTVYNPLVQMGNIMSNFSFAFWAGIDPVTMAKNSKEAIKIYKEKGDAYIKLAEEGLLGTDVVTADLKESGKQRIRGNQQANNAMKPLRERISKVLDKASDFYAGADDVAKISAYISLTKDYGKTHEEASRIVYETFQNYSNVGRLYDLAAKTPVIGNPYVKFKGNLMTIMAKNIKQRPLTAALYLYTLNAFAQYMSNISDEDEEFKKARERRKFIPKIPMPEVVGDIPLVWQTPIGELNMARYFSPFYVYDLGERNSVIEEVTQFAPIQLKKYEGASVPLPEMSDIFLGTYAQVAFNRDFRGMPITDPQTNKYREGNATTEEKIVNGMAYVARQQVPFFAKAQDMYLTMTEERDYYGRNKDLKQTLLSYIVKVNQMGEPEVIQSVEKEIDYAMAKMDYLNKQIVQSKRLAAKNIKGIKDLDISDEAKENRIEKEIKRMEGKVAELVTKQAKIKNDLLEPKELLGQLKRKHKNR